MARLNLSGFVQQAGQQIAQAGNTFSNKLFEAEAFAETERHSFALDKMASDEIQKAQKLINENKYEIGEDGSMILNGKTLMDAYAPGSDPYMNIESYIKNNVKNPQARRSLTSSATQKLSDIATKVTDLLYIDRAQRVAGEGQVALMNLQADKTKDLPTKLVEGQRIVQGIANIGGWTDDVAITQLEKFKRQVVYDSLIGDTVKTFMDKVGTEGYTAAMNSFLDTADYSLTYDGTTVRLDDDDLNNIESRMKAKAGLIDDEKENQLYKIMFNSELPEDQRDKTLPDFTPTEILKLGGKNVAYFRNQYQEKQGKDLQAGANSEYSNLALAFKTPSAHGGVPTREMVDAFGRKYQNDNRYNSLLQDLAAAEGNTAMSTVLDGVVNLESSLTGKPAGRISTLQDLKQARDSNVITADQWDYLSKRVLAASEKLIAKESNVRSKNRITGILDGSITTLKDATAGLTEDDNIVGIANLFIQTMDRTKATAEEQLGITAADKVGGLSSALADRTLKPQDIADAEKWLKDNKKDLGETRFRAYYSDVLSTKWKYGDQAGSQTYATAYSQLKKNPGQYSDEDILAMAMSPEHQASLIALKASETQNVAVEAIAKKYQVNQKIKIGVAPADGEKALELSDLDPAIIGEAAARVYTELLARDSQENASVQLFKEVKEGTVKGEAILNYKGVDASYAINLYNNQEGVEKDKDSMTLYLALDAAERQARGEALREGETTITEEMVKKSGASSAVKQAYLQAIKNLDVGLLNTDIDNFRRESYKNGKIDETVASSLRSRANKLTADAQGSTLSLIESITQNADSLGQQRKNSAASTEAMEGQQTRAEGAKTVFDAFKAGLVDGAVTEENYDAYYDQMLENFGSNIEEAARWTHEMDLAWAKVQDKTIAGKETKVMDAYQELVNSKTVQGYKATGKILDEAFLDSVFTGDSREELKIKEYWAAKMNGFNESHQIAQAEEDAAIRILQDAKFNLFLTLETGNAPKGTVLSPSMLMAFEKKVSTAVYRQFSDAMIQYSQAKAAKDEVDARTETVATPAQVQAGKTALAKLTAYASALAKNKDTLASNSQITIMGETLALNRETFEALFANNAATLITGGFYDEAAKLRNTFSPKDTDHRWDTILAAKAQMEKDKKPWNANDQLMFDSFIQKDRTPAEINEFIRFIKEKKFKEFNTKSINFAMGSFDSSEDWITKAYSGDFEMFVGKKDGTPVIVSDLFKEKLDKHSAEILKEFNKTFGVEFIDGKNSIREITDQGDVMFTIKDKTILAKIYQGEPLKSAKLYLGFYGKDAQIIREIETVKGESISQVYIPSEKPAGATKWGRWVEVEFYRGEGNVIVARKTSRQEYSDRTNGYQNMPRTGNAPVQETDAWGVPK